MFKTDSFGSVIWASSWDYDDYDWFAWPVVDNEETAVVAFGHIDYTDAPWIKGDDSIHGRIGTMSVNLETGDTSNVILYDEELAYYWLTDFLKTPDDGYAALGWYSDTTYGSLHSFILKLDSNRNFEWSKKYLHIPLEQDTLQYAQAWDFEVTPDSGFIVAGHWNDLIMLGKQMPWVFKTDACGDLQWSNCGEIAVSELHEENTWNLYPNPSHDQLNIELVGNHKTQTISIYDSQGNHIYDEYLKSWQDKITMDVSGWSNGMYLIRMRDEEGEMKTRKFLKE